jgi:hypothetical protein
VTSGISRQPGSTTNVALGSLKRARIRGMIGAWRPMSMVPKTA